MHTTGMAMHRAQAATASFVNFDFFIFSPFKKIYFRRFALECDNIHDDLC